MSSWLSNSPDTVTEFNRPLGPSTGIRSRCKVFGSRPRGRPPRSQNNASYCRRLCIVLRLRCRGIVCRVGGLCADRQPRICVVPGCIAYNSATNVRRFKRIHYAAPPLVGHLYQCAVYRLHVCLAYKLQGTFALLNYNHL